MADIPMPPAPTKYTDFISLVFIFAVCLLLLRRGLVISDVKVPDTVAGFALVWEACCLDEMAISLLISGLPRL